MTPDIIASFEFDDDRLLSSLKETKEAIESLKEAQNQMKRMGDITSETFISNAARLKELNAEYNEGLKIINNRQRAMSIDIENYSKEGKSIRELRKETQDLIKVRNEMRINGEQNQEAFKRLNDIIDDNTETIKQNVSAYEKQKMNIGNYSQGIVDAWERIKSGDVKGAVDQIDELGEAWRAKSMTIGGAWKQIASIPVAGWIAGITAVIIMGVNQMIKYNEEMRVLQKETAGITKLQGDALRDATLQSQVLEQALGLDRLESLEAAKALVGEFGITYAEALQAIEDGAIKGGNANKEYLDSIREYPTFFAQAGYSAQEFINVVNAGYDLGIYNDKLPDAIKEFDISIREQTKSTRDALVNAFGAPFADDILKRVREGKTTTKDALIELSKESEKYNLTAKQQAQLTADIFRGAGEDAGGVVKIFGAVRKSAEEANRPLTETEKILKQQTDAYAEMKAEKDKALRSDSIIAFRQEWEVAKLKIATLWYQLIQTVRDVDRAVQGSAGYLRGVFMSLPKAAGTAFSGVLSALAEMIKGFQSGGKAISLFFKGEFEQATVEFGKFTSAIPTMMARVRGAFSGFANDLSAGGSAEYSATVGRYDRRTAANAEIYRSSQPSQKTTNNFDGSATPDKKGKATNSDKTKEAEKEARELERIAEKNRDNAIKYFQSELDAYIKSNQSKIDNAKYLTDALIDIEQKREQDIFDKKVEILGKIRDKELENTKLTADEKARIENEYQSKLAEARAEFEKNSTENARKISEQQAEWNEEYAVAERAKKLQRLIDEGASEFEIRQQQLDNQYEADQERKAIEDELKLIAEEEEDARVLERKAFLEERLAGIEKEYSDQKVEISQMEQEAKLQSYADVASGIAQIAGQETAVGKAAAIASATINTYRGVSAVLADEKLPTFLKPFYVATTIASGIANVMKIGGVNIGGVQSGLAQIQGAAKTATSKKKAERGILLQGNSHAQGGLHLYDQYGNHIVEAEGNEMLAVINKRSTLAALSELNVAGGGIPLDSYVKRAASGGMIGASISTSQFDMTKAMADAVYKATLDGTYAGSQQGLKDLSSDRQIANEATI